MPKADAKHTPTQLEQIRARHLSANSMETLDQCSTDRGILIGIVDANTATIAALVEALEAALPIVRANAVVGAPNGSILPSTNIEAQILKALAQAKASVK